MRADGNHFARQIASSGIAMSTRQALGALLSIGGTLVVTRIIGPETYGVFVSAMAIQSYVGSLANSGIEVSLMRSRVSDHDSQDRLGLMVVLCLSLLGALACLGILPALSRWIDAPDLTAAGLVIFASLPLTVIWIVPRARLSRSMAFGRIAMVELTSQGVGVGVALALAWRGAGIWAPTLGWFCQNFLLTVLFFQSAGLRPSLAWRRSALHHLLQDAWSFSASSFVWQSKSLVSPLIVGHYLGTASVGYVALCARIIEVLGFVRNATWHMMIVSFATIGRDRERLGSYLSKAAELQVLALAPLLVAFSIIGPLAFPVLMGSAWQPVLQLFPYLAGGALATSLTTPAAAALYAVGADGRVLVVRLVQVAVVFTTSWILVPRMGLTGYAYGELTVMVTAALFGVFIRAFAGMVRVHVVGSWVIAATIVIFWGHIGSIAFAAPFLVLLVPGTSSSIRGHFNLLKSRIVRDHSKGH